MQNKTIARLVKNILKDDVDCNISRFKQEQSKGFYSYVYKIKTKDHIYVLKRAKEKELELYQSLNNQLSYFPHFYGYCHLYNKDFILIDYFDGNSAMKMDRNLLVRVIDAIKECQKKYWNSKESFAITFDEAIKRKEKLISYIPDELLDTYNRYLDCFRKTPRTFSHEDLLPFNVLYNNEKICFIDLEVGGILPYPTMLARLIAYTEEKKDSMFYLSKKDYQYALDYYYDAFIKDKGIGKEDYMLTMNLFIFNELIEFVWTYRMSNLKPDDLYNKMYKLSLDKQREINRLN